jgi:antitoxin component of MazEF toxin-antitoxin module
MKLEIRKIGGSAGIILKKENLGALNLKIGDTIDIPSTNDYHIDYGKIKKIVKEAVKEAK